VKKSSVDFFCVLSHIFEESADCIAMVTGDSLYGSDSVFLDKQFSDFCDFFFGKAFSVDRGEFGFGEEVVAMETFVQLVACTILSIFDYVFSLFFQIIFAVNVLTSHGINASWASHNTR
jgi:hypothetical protein